MSKITAKCITVYMQLSNRFRDCNYFAYVTLSYIVTLSCPLATKLEFPTSYATHSAFKYSSKRLGERYLY